MTTNEARPAETGAQAGWLQCHPDHPSEFSPVHLFLTAGDREAGWTERALYFATPTPDKPVDLGADAERGALDRTPAQFFFAIGYGACWAKAFIHNGEKPPFQLTEAVVESAWDTAGEDYDDHAEFDKYLAAANAFCPASVDATVERYRAALEQCEQVAKYQMDECHRAAHSELQHPDTKRGWVAGSANSGVIYRKIVAIRAALSTTPTHPDQEGGK